MCVFRGQKYQETGELPFPWSFPVHERGFVFKKKNKKKLSPFQFNVSLSSELTPISFIFAAEPQI